MSLYFCKIITKLVCKYFRNAYVFFFCCSQINCQNFKINLPSNSHHKQTLRNLTTMCKEKRDNNCHTHTHSHSEFSHISRQTFQFNSARIAKSNKSTNVGVYVCVRMWKCVRTRVEICDFGLLARPGQVIHPACLPVYLSVRMSLSSQQFAILFYCYLFFQT